MVNKHTPIFFWSSVVIFIAFLVFLMCSTAVAQEVHPVVGVQVRVSPATSHKGTGFFVTDKHILTAYHVLDGRLKNTPILITTSKGTSVEVKLIAFSKIRDLALLEVQGPMRTGLPFCFCNYYAKGDKVYLLTYENGKLISKSGKIKKIKETIITHYVRSTIPTATGYSGAPVLKQTAKAVCLVGVHRLAGSIHIPGYIAYEFTKEALND